jgi:pyruvate/2-oxoglutarate/acetoin dehydrogenase E1 component/NAD(P)-dependent dehydrogenase (short-subunit alcohol dehydrogenase family)
VQIFDFVTLMMDMIVNQAAKFRYMLGGRPTVPLVIRGPQGGGIRLAAQHSQSLEAWFAHVPGLVVVAPSSAYDAKGLLIASIRDDNPVMFLEHKLLYLGQVEPVPEQAYAIPLGKAAIRRVGTDVTIVATQAMVTQALQAATRLEGEGISAEVIDPRTLKPLDLDTIVDSVRRTNRLVVVHEGWKFGGIGGEIAASVTEAAFDWLDAPVARVGAPDVPMPFNDRLRRHLSAQAVPVVLVTGGAQGLGAAVCRQMAARGWVVAVADINEAGAKVVAAACGDAAFPVAVDLASADGPAWMVAETVRRVGRLDVLVNCAAVAPAEAFLDMTAGAWEQALLVNVRATALAMAAAGRVMKDQGGGRIITATSAAARMALPNYAAYAATKAAVDSLTRTAAVALAKYGIRVNSLSPGMMDTPLQERTEAIFAQLEGRADLAAFKAERTARIPLGRRSDPEEMAAMVVWLATEAPDYMTAARLNVTGGLDKD